MLSYTKPALSSKILRAKQAVYDVYFPPRSGDSRGTKRKCLGRSPQRQGLKPELGCSRSEPIRGVRRKARIPAGHMKHDTSHDLACGVSYSEYSFRLCVPLAPNSSENSSPLEVSSLRTALPTETPQTLPDQTKYSTVIYEPTGMAHLSSPSGIRVRSQSSIPSREAQYFTDQVRDLAEALNASALICRAPARNGELAMLQGKLEVGLEEVEQLDQKLEGVS
ncbi:hypothetical protein K435DRAFT_806477 [Dendrothele bispora CBS 962.96]|uniref:Uncharacterized protein n=1 Tax=Dendrothele bispora (strain CBS 962.96) TaxID=1314807 RepID=A0A4S8L8E3_DENBC|nr:hypothetical protein K435DRAFT_806477 [Dendrothele bispora CBS 962.96]